MTSTARTRLTSAGLAALGLAALAGCASTAGTASTINDTSSNSSASSSYKDGSYTAQGSYQAPSGLETVTVELTVSNGTVTAVTASVDAIDREAREYQSRFASAISSEVVGKDLSSLSVSRVSGSSLTSNGFNAALDAIRSQAA